MKLNDDILKEILFKEGLDSMLTYVKRYCTYRYEQAYRDGYIMGRGIGYQNGKHEGCVKAVKTIMQAD